MYAQEEIKPYGPEGTKRSQIQKMFDEIAHSYDTLNHSLSLGVDKIWRRSAIRYLAKNVLSPVREVLDIATGTGDFALLAWKELQPSHIIGIDISDEMLRIGREKVAQQKLSAHITLQHEDCECMSFENNKFDTIISSFGLRNFQNLDACLTEMYRVMKQGGTFVVIDLCTPASFPMKQLFGFYKKVVMPLMGRWISHDSFAYTYLPDSMDAIPQGEKMTPAFVKAGFKNVRFQRQFLGMSILYTGVKL